MLARVQFLGAEGKVVSKHKCPTLESDCAGTSME